jgi:hypothetical protein
MFQLHLPVAGREILWREQLAVSIIQINSKNGWLFFEFAKHEIVNEWKKTTIGIDSFSTKNFLNAQNWVLTI